MLLGWNPGSGALQANILPLYCTPSSEGFSSHEQLFPFLSRVLVSSFMVRYFNTFWVNFYSFLHRYQISSALFFQRPSPFSHWMVSALEYHLTMILYKGLFLFGLFLTICQHYTIVLFWGWIQGFSHLTTLSVSPLASPSRKVGSFKIWVCKTIDYINRLVFPEIPSPCDDGFFSLKYILGFWRGSHWVWRLLWHI